MASNKGGLPAVTKSHQFKFLGQKWRFLKHSYENDYEHSLDSGKQRILKEIASIEQKGVDERIFANVEREVLHLLSCDQSGNSITEDNDELEVHRPVSLLQSNLSVASSTTYGGAGAGLNGNSYDELDSNSIVSHLTVYDAQDIQESIKNIKLYYSRQAMDRIDRPVEGKPKEFVRTEHENINGCFAPPSGNPHVSPRPRRHRVIAKNRTMPERKHPLNSSGVKRTNSTSTSKVPSGGSPIKIVETQAGEKVEVDRLQALTEQVKTLNVGKLFKKHSLENNYRVPKCVACVPDK